MKGGGEGEGGREGGDLALFNCFFVCCLVYAHAHVGLQQFWWLIWAT